MPGSPSRISRVASVESIHSDGTDYFADADSVTSDVIAALESVESIHSEGTDYFADADSITSDMIAVFDSIEGFSSESMMPAPVEPTQPAISPSVSGKTSAALSTSSHAPYYTGAPSAEWETIDLSLDGGPGMPRESLLVRLGDKRKSAEDSGSTGERLPKVPRTAIRPSASSSARSETASSKLVQPVVVAYSERHSRSLHRIRWGIQWELARYSMTLPDGYTTLVDPESGLRSLFGISNVDGVEKVLARVSSQSRLPVPHGTDKIEARFDAEKTARDGWQQLDLEHEFKAKQAPGEALYLHDEENGWYGGQVHFTARLIRCKLSGDYRLELDKPCLGPSCEFSRRFGSDRFVRVRIDKDIIYAHNHGLLDYFTRPFIIGGYVFRAFFSRENTVFLFRTVERVRPMPDSSSVPELYRPPPCAGSNDWGVGEFLDWYNSLRLNSAQNMAKWSSRFALGLSNSVPGIRLRREDIHLIDDIISPSHQNYEGKPPAELVMTDGCGLANRAFFEILQRRLSWGSQAPNAVQVRVFGSKGLLMQHPEHMTCKKDERPQIWIRPSQRKIHYLEDTDDPSLLTVNVLRCSHLSSPSALSTETIINLAENGVDSATIIGFIKDSLTERVDNLTTWDGPDGCLRLWHYDMQEGNVINARRTREGVSTARVKGYVFEDSKTADYTEEEDETDGPHGGLGEHSSAWWWDPVSGCPSSLEETAMVLLDSGFDPATSPVLREKQLNVAKKALKSALTKYRADVPMSCSAWAVPDPCGVLGPGEIYVESREKTLIDEKGRYTDRVIGEVLVTRNPCKLPTDVQRARAVDKHELHGLCDVVIVSTKGHKVNEELLSRHLLSMTGGGDYDGDRVQVFWNPALVKGFKSAKSEYATEPPAVATCLERSSETVEVFEERMQGRPDSERLVATQKYLLGALCDASVVGKCSTHWEASVYMHGYAAPETIRLAHVFCAVLDGSKTGVSLKSETYKKDKERYGNKFLPWKKPIYVDNSNTPTYPNGIRPGDAERDGTLANPFIMVQIRDDLMNSKKSYDDLICQRLGSLTSVEPDPHLTKPWEDLQERAKRSQITVERRLVPGTQRYIREPYMPLLVTAIEKQVEHLYAKHFTSKNSKSKGKQKGFTSLHIQQRQDTLRAQSKELYALVARISEDFPEWTEDQLLPCIASYVYLYDYRQRSFAKWSLWPWNIAMGALCAIKAEATSKGRLKTVNIDFYSRFSISKKHIEMS